MAKILRTIDPTTLDTATTAVLATSTGVIASTATVVLDERIVADEMVSRAPDAVRYIPTGPLTPKAFGAYPNDRYAVLNDSLQIDVSSSSNLPLESISNMEDLV